MEFNPLARGISLFQLCLVDAQDRRRQGIIVNDLQWKYQLPDN